ncbi:trypco2 family protein [Nocardia suismassiliense]|uniref:trypco2 family protein n=1 Tax=Nocardia suismassiliense TaxID=2077092 RepID=UPI00131ED581|nr:trypco2 family protein [Nocardia suismassiliense]
MSDPGERLEGKASISAAIGALRDELMQSVWGAGFPYTVNGVQRTLRFKPSPVELTLQVAVTNGGKVSAGVRWWLVTANGEASGQSVSTQTVKLTLEPQMFDENGHQVEVLIDADDLVAGVESQKLDADG